MMALLLSKVLWMASCGGVCNGELQSSYYLDIVINSIVTVEFKLVFGRMREVKLYKVYLCSRYYLDCRSRILYGVVINKL